MKRALIAALVSVLLVSGIAATAAEDELDRTKLGEFVPSSTPFPAPAVSLIDSAGHSLDFADLRGKVVVVNLWATWCEPCLREMPSLERLQFRFGDRIEVLAVSEDRGGDKTVEPFIAKLGLKTVKVYLDPKSEVGHAFGVRGLPTSFVMDRDGKVLGRVEGGAEWDAPKILGVIEPLLSGDSVVKTSSH
jgi:thiol-disulfide isomerase/thioredoxin